MIKLDVECNKSIKSQLRVRDGRFINMIGDDEIYSLKYENIPVRLLRGLEDMCVVTDLERFVPEIEVAFTSGKGRFDLIDDGVNIRPIFYIKAIRRNFLDTLVYARYKLMNGHICTLSGNGFKRQHFAEMKYRNLGDIEKTIASLLAWNINRKKCNESPIHPRNIKGYSGDSNTEVFVEYNLCNSEYRGVSYISKDSENGNKDKSVIGAYDLTTLELSGKLFTKPLNAYTNCHMVKHSDPVDGFIMSDTFKQSLHKHIISNNLL